MKGKNNKVPRLRFSEFTDEWKECKLNTLLTQSRSKNKNLEFDKSQVLSVTAETGVVNQMEYHGRSYAGVSVAPYGILRKGQMVYTKSPLKKYPYGIIKYNEFEDGIVSTLYAIYSVNGKAAGKFLDYYFYYDQRINKYLKPLVNIGAKNDMKVNNEVVISELVTIPSLPEQKKIADFLSKIDSRIFLLNRRKKFLDKYKKGVLQNIFLNNISFKDDDGKDFPKWEEMRAGEVFKSHSNKKHNGDLPILAITQEDGAVYRDSLDKKIYSSEASVKSYKIVEKGDFIISLRSFQGGIEYSDLKGICSPAYTILKPKIKIYDDFFKFYFKKDSFITRLSLIVVGIRDGKQISYEAFSGMKLQIPSLPEQKKIADFLTAIDNKISLVEQQIEKTEAYKKGLLQQMFV